MLSHVLTSLLLLVMLVTGEEVCFEGLECFPLGEPWSSFKRPIPPPQGPDVVKVNFRLFTRNSPKEAYFIEGDTDWNLRGSTFDNRKKTVLFVHGWQGTGEDDYLTILKDALLKNMDVNVIIADYGSMKDNKYVVAVSNARVAGALVAKFLKRLIQYGATSPDRIHLIGVSLGAHVAAYAAKRIPNVARLTGLDPAQPLFEGESKEVLFDRDDALLVDVAHTNGRPVIPRGGLGINSPIGHVDFYFNGGWDQPGCGPEAAEKAWNSLATGSGNPFDALAGRYFCPHFRVMYYYIEAMSNTNCTFWGVRRETTNAIIRILTRGWLSSVLTKLSDCTIETCSPFGWRTFEFPARGSFDIATADKDPFCMNSRETDELMDNKLREYYARQG